MTQPRARTRLWRALALATALVACLLGLFVPSSPVQAQQEVILSGRISGQAGQPVEGVNLFFQQMPTWQKLLWVMICLGLSWALEGSLPLVQLRYRKWRHAWANLPFLATTLAINAGFSALSIGAAAWTAAAGVGLLHLFELPVLVELLIALVVLDLTAQYWAHWLLHQVKWMTPYKYLTT